MKDRVTLLFVCKGNICRSPSAEGVFRHQVSKRGLEDKVVIDSAGVGDWHLGSSPDERAVAAARRRGYDLGSLRARQITREECESHDYVIVMDSENLAAVQRLCPEAKVHRLLDFAPDQKVRDVPDPYFGDEAGFDEVLDLIEEASTGLLAEVQGRLKMPALKV